MGGSSRPEAGRARRRGRRGSSRWRRRRGRRGRPAPALAVGPGERRGADQHDVAAEPVGAGGGELGADQQAREPRAAALGGEAVQQRLGAQREEPRRHPLGAREAVLDRLEEVGLGPAVGRRASCAAPRRPRAARRPRRSCSSRSSPPRRRRRAPTWCGCRAGRRRRRSRGSAATRPAICVSSPRMTSAGLSWLRPGRMRTESRGIARRGLGERGGRRPAGDRGVGRLGPGAARAGHAADDDVGARVRREPRVDDREQRRLEAFGRERRRAVAGRRPSAITAPAASIAQARRFDEPQSTAIQAAVIRAPRRRRRPASGR